MLPSAPPAFKLMCQNFGPNLGDFVASWEDMVQLALHNLDIGDAKTLVPFIDELLSGPYSDHDLREFWWTMPVTTVFETGDQVRTLLTRIRETLAKPPYT